MHLAKIAPLVGSDQQAHGILRRRTSRQQRHSARSVVGIEQRLAGDRPDAGPDEDVARPHRQELARHGDADPPRPVVARDDGIRHYSPPVCSFLPPETLRRTSAPRKMLIGLDRVWSTTVTTADEANDTRSQLDRA